MRRVGRQAHNVGFSKADGASVVSKAHLLLPSKKGRDANRQKDYGRWAVASIINGTGEAPRQSM
jgi:hypothetical protein